MSLKDKLDDQNCPNNGSLTKDKPECLTPDDKTQDTSNELFMKMVNRKAISEKQQDTEQQRNEVKKENCQHAIGQEENQSILQSEALKKKEMQEDEMGGTIICKKKKNDGSCRKSGSSDTVLASKNCDTHQKSRPVAREKLQSSFDSADMQSEKETNKKPQSRLKSASKEVKVSFESSDKYSKTLLKHTNIKGDQSSRMSDSSEAHNRKRKKPCKEKHLSLKYKQEAGNTRKSTSKHRQAKIKRQDEESKEPSMSFECYLNYDLNVSKRRERTAAKNPCKKIKNVEKKPSKHSGMKPVKSSVTSVNMISSGKVRLTDYFCFLFLE